MTQQTRQFYSAPVSMTNIGVKNLIFGKTCMVLILLL